MLLPDSWIFSVGVLFISCLILILNVNVKNSISHFFAYKSCLWNELNNSLIPLALFSGLYLSLVDINQCPECLTGQRGCVPSEASCWVEGECKGNEIHVSPSQTKEDCLAECQSTFGCKWFTFRTFKSPQPVCFLFSDCPSIDETCETCISGERRCEQGGLSTTTITTTTSVTSTTTAVPPLGNYYKFLDLEMIYLHSTLTTVTL